ncbi:MAG: hypothetical protein ACRC4T_05140 [Cetobacterium sp.]
MKDEIIVYDVNKKSYYLQENEIKNIMKQNILSFDKIYFKYSLNLSSNKSIVISEKVFQKLKNDLGVNEIYNSDEYEIISGKIGIINSRKITFKLKKYKCFSDDLEEFKYKIFLCFDFKGKLIPEEERPNIEISSNFFNKLKEELNIAEDN